MSNENPMNSREKFEEAEGGIEQKKKAIAQALEAGDYDSVSTLAQEAKGMEQTKSEMVGDAHSEALEMNRQVDEEKAAEEKASREAAAAEAAAQDAERSQQEAAALLAKMQGGGVEAPVIERPEPTAEEVADAEKIFGRAMRGPETSGQFEGSKIFMFNDNNGRNVYYALRRNAEGQLEGNKFSIMEKTGSEWKNFVATGLGRLDQRDPNVTVGPVYQMHEPDLKKIEALLRSRSIEI